MSGGQMSSSMEVGMAPIAGMSILPHGATKALGTVPRLHFWGPGLRVGAAELAHSCEA